MLGTNYNRKISDISEIIPDHLSTNNEDYTNFLNGYISFLEEHASIVKYINIIENNDIDTTHELRTHFRNIFGKGIPSSYKGNEALLYKDLMDLYRTSGTIESLQLFFKIFYESPDVDVTFPKDNLLIASPSNKSNGMLSNPNIRLHDSLFYQMYSYMLSNIKISKSQWGDIFNTSQHPLGYMMFSDIVYTNLARFRTDTPDHSINTCLEPAGSFICSTYILELLNIPVVLTSSVVANIVQKILILYDVDRPLGMRAWFDEAKFNLITTNASWDLYSINDVLAYIVPGNPEAFLENHNDYMNHYL
jgi:hypothetical protein